MASNAIYSASPNIILNGIRDLSTRPVTPEQETFPQHLPLFWTFSPEGDEEFNIMTGSQIARSLGDAAMDPNSAYCTHATPFIQGLASEANMMMIKRLRPSDATTAWLRFSVGITKVKLSDGPDALTGYQLRWITSSTKRSSILTGTASDAVDQKEITSRAYGKGLSYREVGPLTGSTDTLVGMGISASGLNQEREYPIFDLEVSSFGAYGNNLGVRLFSPNAKNETAPPDEDLYNRTLARPVRLEFVKRVNARSSAFTVSTLLGENSVDVVLKPNINDPRSGDAIYIEDVLLDSYRDLDTTNGKSKRYGPFNRLHVYRENIEHILKSLYEAELATDVAQGVPREEIDENGVKQTIIPEYRLTSSSEYVDASELFWQMDFINGKNFQGEEYRSFKIMGFAANREKLIKEGKDLAILKEQFTHWADGGSDGTMGNDVYNELVLNELMQFNEDNEYTQIARYPFSVFYDTGYPMEVKRKLPRLLIARKDVTICLSTHEVGAGATKKDGVNTLTRKQEVSRIRTISEFVRAYEESELYGTACCRANVIMQAGQIINNSYTGYVPLTYELAMKRAKFMGDPTGNMRGGYGYDQDGMKQIKYMKNIDNSFYPQVAREQNWTLGATWAQYYDRNTLFFPAVRTVYKDETSVLLSDINMLIAVDLNKVAFRAWRRLVGNAKLTDAQFEEQSDRYITEDCEGRYDGRVKIVPDTHYTAADKQRGYSWHCDINMYANNMKTVGVYTIVAYRQEDLEG